MAETIVRVWVPGQPKGQPRPRACVRGGKAAVYDPGTAEGWKGDVALALRAVAGRQLMTAVRVRLLFRMPRPMSHFRRDGTLRETAPYWYTAKPDADNLEKACLDAMTDIGVWRDDSLVTWLDARKTYTPATGQGPGCEIVVETLEAEHPPSPDRALPLIDAMSAPA